MWCALMIISKKDNGYLVEWGRYVMVENYPLRHQISRVCTKQSAVLIAVQEYLTDKDAA